MNTPAILLTVLAVVYSLCTGAALIAMCSIVNRQRTAKVSMTFPLFVSTLLLVAAYFADTNL